MVRAAGPAGRLGQPPVRPGRRRVRRARTARPTCSAGPRTSATPAPTTPRSTTGTRRRSRRSGATSPTPSPGPAGSTPRWSSDDRHTYLFSGDQYVRYTGTAYDARRRRLPARARRARRSEPRFANPAAVLDGRVDAAFADRRNVYLFAAGSWHVVSDTLYRTYDAARRAGCAFVEDGAVLVEEAGGWHRWSALEGAHPRADGRCGRARCGPSRRSSGPGSTRSCTARTATPTCSRARRCYDTAVGRGYPLAEAWGRPRNTIDQDNAVDAAFAGRDGRTYLFRGDQYVVYDGPLTGDVAGGPRPVTALGRADPAWCSPTSTTGAPTCSGSPPTTARCATSSTPAPDYTAEPDESERDATRASGRCRTTGGPLAVPCPTPCWSRAMRR